MVAVNPAEWDAMRKGKDRLEELSPFDRELVSADRTKHLIIPMCDIYNLRRIAGILNGLAAEFDVLSRRHDIKARSLVMEAQAAVDYANREIRKMTGKGKRKRPWEREDDPRYRGDVDNR